MSHPKTYTIVVLNDGETWTEVHRCSICVITAAEMNALADGEILIEDLTPLSKVMLYEV